MLEQVFRDEWGRVLAAVVGYLGDFELAEESVAEAFAVAARRWPAEGVPASPAAWLVTTARHRAIDRLRRDRVLAAKLRLLAATTQEVAEAGVDETEIPDERLELIFTCCHPALAPEAQVALTLRAVAGLGTEDIASSFLVSAETMKRRLTRAKTKIRDAGIPFSVPAADRLPDRLAVVLAVVYLIFNQGYSAPGQAGYLAAEAVRLGRVLASLLPGQPEPRGLLALMLLHDARRLARLSGADGQDLVLLADQDRALWDWPQIAEAREIIDRAVDSRGPYLVQAAIASLQLADPIELAAGRRAVRGARRADRLACGPAQRRGRDRRSRRAGRRPGHRRRARPDRIPLLALDQGRAAAPPRARRPGAVRLPRRPCPRRYRARAPLPAQANRGMLSGAAAPVRANDPCCRWPCRHRAAGAGRRRHGLQPVSAASFGESRRQRCQYSGTSITSAGRRMRAPEARSARAWGSGSMAQPRPTRTAA